MSAPIQAIRLQICVFVMAEKVYEDQSLAAKQMHDAFANVVIDIQQQFHSTAPIELDFCPLTYNENAVIIAQQHLDPSRLPAAQVTALYPNGQRRQYFLKSGAGGIDFTSETVRPYVEALLYNRVATPQPILCKIFPPLCNLGGWVWLALAMGATYKATQARNVGKVAWGVGAVSLWQGWYARGGLEQVKQAAGIGKYYDEENIKPGTRIDQYWGTMKVDPNKLGVESRDGKQYFDVEAAIHHFQLYSLEFGNWMNQQDRLDFMYATMVTLRDMAAVLGISQDRMGLKRTLSLAFGSRGQGGRTAGFYQPNVEVINLTKTMGPGIFCHEYGHAIDFYLGKHSQPRSTRKQPNYTGKRKDSTAWLFEHVLDGVLWNEDGTPSSYQKWLETQREYYHRRTEIFARICETYFLNMFKQKGIKNWWGVDGDRVDLPRWELVEKVSASLKKIFQKI